MNQTGEDYQYRYNGIEHSEELGLDLAPFRSYDPAIGRWMQIDPRAEKYVGMSPYNGMGNNPISISDPNGDTLRIQVTAGDMNDAGGNAIVNDNGEIIAGNGHQSVVYTPGMSATGRGKHVDAVIGALNYLYENVDKAGIDEIVSDPSNSTVTGFVRTKKGGPNRVYFDDNSEGSGGSYLMWDRSVGMEFHPTDPNPGGFYDMFFGERGYRSPAEALNHELEHNRSFFSNSSVHFSDSKTYVSGYDNEEEFSAIQVENRAAKTIYGAQAVMRQHHRGYFVKARYGLYPKK